MMPGKLVLPKKLVITGISRITGAHQVEEQTKPATQAATSKTKLLQAYLVHNQEMDVGPWAKLYDRQLLHDQQLRFANQGRFEDSLFNLCFLEQLEPNEIGFVNKPEYFLYKRSGSLTNSYEPELEKKMYNLCSSSCQDRRKPGSSSIFF